MCTYNIYEVASRARKVLLGIRSMHNFVEFVSFYKNFRVKKMSAGEARIGQPAPAFRIVSETGL